MVKGIGRVGPKSNLFRLATNVRFGSKADIRSAKRHGRPRIIALALVFSLNKRAAVTPAALRGRSTYLEGNQSERPLFGMGPEMPHPRIDLSQGLLSIPFQQPFFSSVTSASILRFRLRHCRLDTQMCAGPGVCLLQSRSAAS
jgi:hypothetical protein